MSLNHLKPKIHLFILYSNTQTSSNFYIFESTTFLFLHYIPYIYIYLKLQLIKILDLLIIY